MVYESDFYTTRRPYRPSTYSVSFEPIRQYYPYVVTRLVPPPRTRIITSPTYPYHMVTVRVRPSVVLRELDRISHRKRPHFAYSPTEEFLQSDSSKRWEDETRRIRADTEYLRQKIHSTVPRANSVIPLSKLSAYSDHYIPIRITSDDYIARLLLPIRSIPTNIRNMSWYPEPARKFTGRGHLACIRYSGNKAFSNRRSMYPEQCVREDVNLLSFYAKNRLAAAGLALDSVTVKLFPWRPTRRFDKPAIMEDPALELKAAKAERLERFMAKESGQVDDADFLAEKKKRQQEEAKLAEERALAEELARNKAEAKRREEDRAAELARQEELAAAAEQANLEKEEADRKTQEKEQKRRAKEEAKKAEERRQAEERERLAEEARLAEGKKSAENERLAQEQERIRQEELAKLAEIERQAEEEQQSDLARQAAELAELARQEAELAELERQEAELAKQEEEARKHKEAEEAAKKKEEEEFEELARQETELLELEKQEAELRELERQEAEAKERARQEEDLRRQEEELAELERQEAELRELERQEAELKELERQTEKEPETPQTDVTGGDVDAEFEELAKQEAELEELARREAELEELANQEEELKELARQAAELAELDAEARALAESAADGLPNEIDDEDLNVEVEEPASEDHAAYVSESENAEGDITDDE